jgi:hypothetical protein
LQRRDALGQRVGLPALGGQVLTGGVVLLDDRFEPVPVLVDLPLDLAVAPPVSTTAAPARAARMVVKRDQRGRGAAVSRATWVDRYDGGRGAWCATGLRAPSSATAYRVS